MKNKLSNDKVLLNTVTVALFLATWLGKSGILQANESNPFASALPGKKVIVEEKPQKVVSRPSISIQGLVWQSPMPQAIINNRVVKVGDFITEGIQIVDISKEGIVVEYQGARFFYSSGLLSPIKTR